MCTLTAMDIPMLNPPKISIAWTEISELDGFNICYYDDETAYLQFNCDPPMSDTPACNERMRKAIMEKFGISIHAEDIEHYGDGDMSLSFVGSNTYEELIATGISVSDEA